MKLLKGLHKNTAAALVSLLLLTITCRPCFALIEDALDVFHVVKEVTTAVLKTWDIVQSSPIGSNINFPLMREKQRKVLSRLKEVSKQIISTEDQVSSRHVKTADLFNTLSSVREKNRWTTLKFILFLSMLPKLPWPLIV